MVLYFHIICAFCFLPAYAIYVGSHLGNELVDLCQTKRVSFDLVNILTERKNVFHLSEYSAKWENSNTFLSNKENRKKKYNYWRMVVLTSDQQLYSFNVVIEFSEK